VACLDNEPVFLDEDDQRVYHRVCRNYVMSRHCAPGFGDPNLPVQVRRVVCEEKTLGELDRERQRDDSEAKGAVAGEPPEPSPEDQARMKLELGKVLQRIREEKAQETDGGSTAPAP
jgi:hypothetical protein